MSSRLVFVDGLRGIAATMVVLYHLVGRTPAQWLTSRGYLGVAIFFVLSGFVISMSVGERRISLSFLGRFAARRAVRLDPPYWTSIILALLFAVAAAQVGLKREMPTPASLAAHLFYLQDLLEFEAISPIYWTLCFEVQFYLFLILLLWLGQSLRAFVPIWFAVFGASLLENAGIIDIAHPGLFLKYWYAFALGAVTYWVTIGRMRARTLAIAVAAVLVATPFRHADWLIAVAVTSCVLYVAAARGTMTTWLSDRVMQFLGRISYSLYLFHPLIGWTAMSVALRYVDQWLALAVGLVVSILSAWIAYRVVENQSIKLSRRISLGAPKALAPLEKNAPAA